MEQELVTQPPVGGTLVPVSTSLPPMDLLLHGEHLTSGKWPFHAYRVVMGDFLQVNQMIKR